MIRDSGCSRSGGRNRRQFRLRAPKILVARFRGGVRFACLVKQNFQSRLIPTIVL